MGISDCTFGVFYTKAWGISDPSRHRILPFCNMQHDSIYCTELHFVSISVLETVLLPSLDCPFVHTRSSTPSSLYQIFSCSLLLCPEFYAQSTTFIFFYKWCKITYFAIVNLVLSSFAFVLFICFSIDHRSLNFAFLLINNILLPTKNCPSCCGYHKL